MDTNSLMNPARRISLKVLTSLRWSRITPRMLPGDRTRDKISSSGNVSMNLWLLFAGVNQSLKAKFKLFNKKIKNSNNIYSPLTDVSKICKSPMTDQLLSKFHIIPSINEYVQWVSDNNENCPSEPRVASTVQKCKYIVFAITVDKKHCFWSA